MKSTDDDAAVEAPKGINYELFAKLKMQNW